MTAAAVAPAPARIEFVNRHSALVRVTHWINVVCLTLLLMSGLQIFNAHPALYLGNGAGFDHPVLSLDATQDADGNVTGGTTTLFGHTFATTGVLGASKDENGDLTARGFPSWITAPSYQDLATGRRWHFFFAWIFAINGFVYLANLFFRRHLTRDLLPTAAEIRAIPKVALEHARLHFPKGEEAKRYNVLQQLTYLVMALVVLPGIVLAGLTMSPGMDARFPFLVALFHGRQTARTIHFVFATLIVLFVLVHVLMVILSGLWNNLRSMVTGRYAIEVDADAR
ncbi:MAG: cytochrome b/b6 domain-containing protein [Hyphomicrobiales bacterium]|nr:cytochrome b/b6 domain-containing protein [Hyphomicrobiales bacterium]